MSRFYVLGDDGQPVPCHDTGRWESWMVENRPLRTIRKSYAAAPGAAESRIDTTFLGIDHNFLGAGPAVLWETLISGGPYDGHRERYVRREIAEARHEQLVADLRDGTFAPYDQRGSVAVIAARKVIRDATAFIREDGRSGSGTSGTPPPPTTGPT